MVEYSLDMRALILTVVALVIFGSGLIYYFSNKSFIPTKSSTSGEQTKNSENKNSGDDVAKTIVIAGNLDTPWAIAFLPEGSMLVTERPGRVRLIDRGGNLDPDPVASLSTVEEIGEGGLLGIVTHPNFSSNNFVYLYYAYSSSVNDTLNRVVRMTYRDKRLIDEKIIVDRIPGAANHNGGRIKFGPDGFLYIATGDAQEPSRSQNTNSLAGKILRVTDEGRPAPNNPFGNEVYSLGHRNVQGLAWSENGVLWTTEHGRSGVLSGLDELNLIEAGKNYGWPEIQGNEKHEGMETPKRNSGSDTWAPSGDAFIDSNLYFSGLRGQALYKATIENNNVVSLNEYFKGEFGRIREVIKGLDGMLYITTSNRDGRANPRGDDDKIIRINPDKL